MEASHVRQAAASHSKFLPVSAISASSTRALLATTVAFFGPPPMGEHGVVDLSPEEFLDRLADLVQVHDDRDAIQASAAHASPDELPVIDIHSR